MPSTPYSQMSPQSLTQKFWLVRQMPSNTVGDNGDFALLDVPRSVGEAIYIKVANAWHALNEVAGNALEAVGLIETTGSGPPDPAVGEDGDWTHVSAPTSVGTSLYVKISGVWVSLQTYIFNYTLEINSRSRYFAIGASGATPDVNLANGDLQSVTVSEDAVFTFTSPWGATAAGFVLIVTNGGAFTVTWPAVLWEGGTEPALSAAGVDVISFFFDGTNWFGQLIGLDYS